MLGDGCRSATEEPTRRVKRIFVLALAVIIATAVVVLGLREGPLTADIAEDQFVVDKTMRDYRIVVPHKRMRPTPVVFAFHGIGDSTASMANYSRLDRVAAQNGFILVYPAALRSMWATMNVDFSDLDSNPDVRFFDQLLDHLTSMHQIDRDRIYVMGMSNGATFAQLLATARSNQIAAVVAHSGPRLKGLAKCDPTLPIMLIVGENDSACSPMNADADQYRRNGNTVEYVSVPRLAHAWSARHNNQMWRFLSRHVRHKEDVAEPSDTPKPPNGAF
jgi:polyhydroxybutyrate depolymerase